MLDDFKQIWSLRIFVSLTLEIWKTYDKIVWNINFTTLKILLVFELDLWLSHELALDKSLHQGKTVLIFMG